MTSERAPSKTTPPKPVTTEENSAIPTELDLTAEPDAIGDRFVADLAGVEEDDELPLCACGKDRYHFMVSPLPEYTAWATFWLTVMGVSATPQRIRFQCRLCKDIFDMTDDPDELKKFM